MDHIIGQGFIPRPAGCQGANGVYELLMQALPISEHGGPFRYDNGSTDALGRILQRSLDESIAQRIGCELGAEQEAIAPTAEIVIAQFSIDPHLAALKPLRLRGYQAVADALR